MKQFLVAAIAAMSIHASSHADVMYRWIDVTDGKPANVAMTLVFSDDAVAQGAFSYHLAPSNTVSDGHGLKSFGFSINGITPMSYTPGAGLFAYGMGRLDMILSFDPAGYLTGSISANDQNSDFAMASSSADLFAFTRMGSDQDPMGTKFSCGAYTPYACTSTGMLERVSTMQPVRAAALVSADVPEPGSLALISAGLLGLLGLGRAKRRG